MRTLVSLFFLFAILAIAPGCFKDADTEVPPCSYDSCAKKASAAEIAAVQRYVDSMQITGTTQHCSGLIYKIENQGTGKAPTVCDNSIVARYKGSLTNGHVFDSGTFQRPVPLGGGLITGWANGLPMLKEGGRMTLYIPPSLGYGSQVKYDGAGNVAIPANSITIFDVELLSVY